VVFGDVSIRTLGALLPESVVLPDWVAVPFTVFAVVGITNAVNLSDGLDGLAGGISLLAFACIGYLAFQGQGIIIALIAIALSGAVFGFLRFNSHPATLFMGDTGSQLLGFSAVSLGIMLTQEYGVLNKILPFVLVGFPVLDTISIMVARMAKGQSPFLADKNHYHHKLMRLGFSHKEAVIVIYLLQVLLVTGAFLMREQSEWLLLGFYAGSSGAVLLLFRAAERTGWRWKRYDILDLIFTTRLRALQAKNIGIKVSFRALGTSLPGLLLLSCFVPAGIPVYCSASAFVLAGIVMAAWFFGSPWVGAAALRVSLYLSIPYIVYFSEMDPAGWVNGHVVLFYNLSFGVVVLFMVATLKFTRRRKGFQTTPMDYLILFAVIVMPNLPGMELQHYHLNVIITKIVVFFFGFEVLMGELRGQFRKIALVTLGFLLIMGIRGFI
jgi:UDP-GlcNAc:undecaprenyl-phosphate GlcNAc-1-phosphate transferase